MINQSHKLILKADSLLCDDASIFDKIIVNDPNMYFLSNIMQYNQSQLKKDRQNAINHFKKQFGLDFSSATPNKNNASIISGAVLKPFYISPHINYRATMYRNCRINGCVRQGGWIVLIVDDGVTLTGQYGGSSGKEAEIGNILLFGYYNILIRGSGLFCGNNCRVIHFRSSIPSKITKDNIWSIKVDVWDPLLDNKYKQMTGWYREHYHKSMKAKSNCQEYKIPDEGFWGKTSGCSSLVKKCVSGSKKWHLTITTILEFPVIKRCKSVSRVGDSVSQRAGGSSENEIREYIRDTGSIFTENVLIDPGYPANLKGSFQVVVDDGENQVKGETEITKGELINIFKINPNIRGDPFILTGDRLPKYMGGIRIRAYESINLDELNDESEES